MKGYILIIAGKSMEGTVQGHCFSIYINKCNILKTLTQLKYWVRTTRNSTTPAGISSLCVTVTTHPYSKEQGCLLWDCLGAGPCSHTWKHEGDWHKHQGFHWIKHCMQRPKCFSLQLAVPWVFSSEGKAKQVLQAHCGDLKKQFCFKTALTWLFL